jgi:hypothetical protein
LAAVEFSCDLGL